MEIEYSLENLNDPNSQIYKNALKLTQNIESNISKSRLNCLTNECVISGPLEDILAHLKGGPAKNLINSFFKYKTDKCDNCGIHKSRSVQLDRAHFNKDNCDRSSLLRLSIEKYFIDDNTPIKIKFILITFIKYHRDKPLFILCKKCHREYDKPC